MISPLYSAILGFVEGLTEFLPISSTGHLILTSHLLGLPDDEATKAFEVVIQSGALLAVIGIYMKYIRSMVLGLMGKDPAGRTLAVQLFVAFLPAAVVGLLANKWIKAHLFGVAPVVVALVIGGVLMIALEYYRDRKAGGAEKAAGMGCSLTSMTLRAAFLIGVAQCLAMWPGTSRSMVTIVAALLLGFRLQSAAEFSFLLALPTLGAATAHDLMKDGPAILHSTGWLGLAIGFSVSFIVAWVAVKAFLAYLTRHGMGVFGWYRIALAVVVCLLMWQQLTAPKPDQSLRPRIQARQGVAVAPAAVAVKNGK